MTTFETETALIVQLEGTGTRAVYARLVRRDYLTSQVHVLAPWTKLASQKEADRYAKRNGTTLTEWVPAS